MTDGFDPLAHASRELASVGSIIDIAISGRAANVPPLPARGLIDTGSSVVFIDRRLALQAGLKAVDMQPVQVPGGVTIEATVFAGVLAIPVLGFKETTRFYAAAHKQASHDVLLGRSLLSKFVITFDGPAGRFHFYKPFNFPGPASDDDYAT
jgi:hypothetical protein